MDNTDTRKLLTDFGYDAHTACLIAAQARRHNLTQDDITAWIAEARASNTIRNPKGFVRARIQGGDKPPSSSASRSSYTDRKRYLVQFACPECGTYPCVCDWDPETEDLHDYRQRKLEQERSQS